MPTKMATFLDLLRIRIRLNPLIESDRDPLSGFERIRILQSDHRIPYWQVSTDLAVAPFKSGRAVPL
jgi:hypothetical protein